MWQLRACILWDLSLHHVFCATAQSCLYIPDNGCSQIQSPFMVDHLHRSTSAAALTSAQLTFIICTDGSILSHWVVFSFQARADIWGLLALALPPTSGPHSCSCNEAEHHRCVREESFVWPPETSTQIFTSPITVYTPPAWWSATCFWRPSTLLFSTGSGAGPGKPRRAHHPPCL